jgi:hypothetical protein
LTWDPIAHNAAYCSQLFEASHEVVEQEPEHADHHHPGYHQVVSVPRIPGIHGQEAEPGVERDHLGGDYDQPRDAEADAHPDDDVREGGGDDDEAQQPEPGDPEVLGGPDVLALDGVNAGRGVPGQEA